jgi:probable F420-dependent oxidoreductase
VQVVSDGEIRFGIQAGSVPSGGEWLDLAIKAEDLGYDVLYVADHVGLTPSPFTALAAAAAVTSTLRLGTYVLNCGIREPLAVASDAATLDQLSGGRVVLGLGAGHTPGEWTMSGVEYPSAADRVGRLVEMVDVVSALMGGAVVTHHGRYLHLDEAVLASPRPVQERIPILVGGNGSRVLELAGRRADVVGLTGLGRMLADGHRHQVDWQTAAIDERVSIVRTATAAAERTDVPILDALVQYVEVTDDRDEAAARCAGLASDLDASAVVRAPYILVGSVDQLVEELTEHRTRWGITSYVVRADAIDTVAPVIDRLRIEDT